MTHNRIKEAFIAGVYAGNGRIDSLCCTRPYAIEHVAIREDMYQEFLQRTTIPNDEAMHVETVVVQPVGRPPELDGVVHCVPED